ncbi:MAG: glycosyltransferase family 2 protein [Bacteroidaceae bacterium]|nr:glycosyltransferase family 2 protein [Bacteroidaceae bacterium]
MEPVKLSVVIVSYNVRYHLEQCLHSVQRALLGINAEVWVVDNASTDGSVEYLQPRFPEVKFISNAENLGFSRANNLAIRKSLGEYVLLLNPDTIVAEDTLRVCLNFLDSHPEVGATGVRMLHPDGRFAPESRRGLPTPFTSFCKMSGLGTLFPNSRVFGRYYMRYLDPEKPNPIEVISGAFNMIRKRALDQIGLLDEDFFMYGEDIDLSYRLLQGGWQNYYLPCLILHYKGESTEKSSYRYVHVFYEAMLIFFNKHYGKRHYLLGQFIRLAVYVRALIDMWQRLVQRIRTRLHCPVRYAVPGYVRFDFDNTTVKEMLERLHNQPHGKRLWIETFSRATGKVIRPGEVLDWEGES